MNPRAKSGANALAPNLVGPPVVVTLTVNRRRWLRGYRQKYPPGQRRYSRYAGSRLPAPGREPGTTRSHLLREESPGGRSPLRDCASRAGGYQGRLRRPCGIETLDTHRLDQGKTQLRGSRQTCEPGRILRRGRTGGVPRLGGVGRVVPIDRRWRGGCLGLTLTAGTAGVISGSISCRSGHQGACCRAALAVSA